MMILLIDNYDSFTYNLVQRIGELDASTVVEVRRHDAITLDEMDEMGLSHLIISPGPGTPDDAGISVEAIRHLAGKIPILGVCLGNQCIAQAYGGRIRRAERMMHGKTSAIHHDGRTVFSGLTNPFTATRYHSLTVDRASLPGDLTVSAWTNGRNEIMGLRHKSVPVEGVQFHPESFLTDQGRQLIANFLAL